MPHNIFGAIYMTNGCCFTGHRIIPNELLENLRVKLWESVDYLHNERKIDTFYGVSQFVMFHNFKMAESLRKAAF